MNTKTLIIIAMLAAVLIAALCLCSCSFVGDVFATAQPGGATSAPATIAPATGAPGAGTPTPTEVPTEAPTAEPTAEPEPDYESMHLKVSVTDEGYDIFTPTEGKKWGYRYGPSIMYHEDGSIDAWFASPGSNGSSDEMDWFTYKHSDDGGRTWSDEIVALYPTPGSLDRLSVCDPGAFYMNGYYYLGYTSTIDGFGGGYDNNAFVARSKSPAGPYEKWNGKGWGGDPWPIHYFTGIGTAWGEGEPSFVVVDGTIYIYITLDTEAADGNRVKGTRLWTADANNENWPATMEYRGWVMDRSDHTDDEGYVFEDMDSWDVAYVEQYKKFIALCSNRRFVEESCLVYFESNDGVNFTRVGELNTNVRCGCHNAGLMKDELGHIKEGDPMLLGYAYAGAGNAAWGLWATRFAPIEITVTEAPDRSEDGKANLKAAFIPKAATDDLWVMGLTTEPHEYRKNLGKGDINLRVVWYDTDYGKHAISDPADLEFSGYDESIITIKDGKATPLKTGSTPVTVKYLNAQQTFLVTILEDGISTQGWDEYIAEFIPTITEYTVSLSQKEAVQIRTLVRLANNNLCELYNSSRGEAPYTVKCSSSAKKICSVGKNCIIMPQAKGDAEITVTCESYSYKVTVHVTD